MIERLVLALPVLLLTGVALWGARGRNAFSPSVIAVGMTAVVAVFFPLLSAVVEPSSWRHGVHLEDRYVLGAQAQYLAFTTGLCAVVMRIRLIRPRRRGEERVRERSAAAVAHRDQLVALGLVVGGALLYGVYVAKVGLGPLLDRSNFAEKYRVSGGLGTFYAGLNLMMVGCLWAEASQLPRRTTNLFRACAAGILLWSVAAIAVRSYAVTLLLGYLYLWARQRRFTVSRVRPALILVVGLSYVGVEAYSLLRSVWDGSLASAVVTLQEELPDLERTAGQVVGGSEFSHPFLTMMELDRHEVAGELAGAGYAQGLLGFAPVWLVPDREVSVAQEFARRHYPELAERGGGTAFCLVGEAWWNIGSILGPLLAGLALGWLLMWAERNVRVDPGGIVSRLLPYTLHLVLLVHRNSFPSLLKQVFIVALPVAALLLTSSLLWNGLRAKRRGLALAEVR